MNYNRLAFGLRTAYFYYMGKYILLFLFFTGGICAAQVPALEASYRENSPTTLSCQVTAANGETVILGKSTDSFNTSSFSLFSVRPDGQISWQHFMHDSVNHHQDMTKLKLCSDKGFIVSGSFTGYNNGFVRGIYLYKTDSTGQRQWSYVYPPNGANSVYPGQVRQTADGGFIVVSTIIDQQSSSLYYFSLLKTDSAGNRLWAMDYPLTVTNKAYAFDLVEDLNGDYYICGDLDDVSCILKASHTGIPRWFKTYGQTVSFFSQMTAIERSNHPGYLIGSSFILGGNSLLEIDTLGAVSWMNFYTSSPNPCLFWDITPNAAGTGYGICGKVQYQQVALSPGFLVSTDNSGVIQHIHSYAVNNGGGEMYAIDTIPGGGYSLGGMHVVNANNSQTRIYLIRSDSTGKQYCNENTFSITQNKISPIVTPVPVTYTPDFSRLEILSPVHYPVMNDSVICVTVGMQDAAEENESLVLRPNPAEDFLSISGTGTGRTWEAAVYSADGKLLLQQTLRTAQNLDIRGLAPGFYLLRLMDGDTVLCRPFVRK